LEKSCVLPGIGRDPEFGDTCDSPLSTEDFFLALENSLLPLVVLKRIAAGEKYVGAHYPELLSFLVAITDRSTKTCKMKML
jgi:hypothetical protein